MDREPILAGCNARGVLRASRDICSEESSTRQRKDIELVSLFIPPRGFEVEDSKAVGTRVSGIAVLLNELNFAPVGRGHVERYATAITPRRIVFAILDTCQERPDFQARLRKNNSSGKK
jgi:hypothetical protein